MEPSLTRVAVVQLAYHPAILVETRSPLEDPGGLEALLPELTAVPKDIRPKLTELRRRIRVAYVAQTLQRVQAILAACRGWGVQLVVFPEYSIPRDILEAIAASAKDLVVVAGTHMVEPSPGCLVVYERVGWPKDSAPTYGQAVAPVLHQGRLIGLSPKFHPAVAVGEEMEPGKTWAPVAMPEGIAGPMGVMVCLDFLYRENPEHQALVAGPLAGCRFLAVPSLTRRRSVEQFAEKAWEEAKRYGRPVLYANQADGGGTAIFVDEERRSNLLPFPRQPGCFEAGDEGVIVADVDLGFTRPGGSTLYGATRPVRPVAAASLVYRVLPDGEAYAAWLDESGALFAREDQDARDALVARVGEALNVLQRAGAQPGAKMRRERLDRLGEDAERLMRVENVRQLTREVVVPAEVLPLDALQAALATGAAEVVQEWLEPHPELGTVVKRLREAGAAAAGKGWTSAGREAVGRVVSAVRGAVQASAKLDPLPPRVVLLSGIDPKALGTRRHGGLVLTFRSHPADFRTAGQSGEPRPRQGLPLAYLQEAEELWLLATAEGAGNVATVGVWVESSAYGDLFVLSLRDRGWVLWTRTTDRWIDPNYAAILAALGESGLHDVEIEAIPRETWKDRVLAFLGRFEKARSVIHARLAERLAEVGGHFVEPTVRIDDAAPELVLGALERWIASVDQTALLLGEFGSGKSTVLARWAESRWLASDTPRTILVNLAGVATSSDPERQLLDASGVEDTPAHRAALRLLIRHRILVPCFDGFDEMATRVGLADLGGRLASLLEIARGGGQVLVSCRDNYFPTQQHLHTATESALALALGESAGVWRMVVELFDGSRVAELVNKVRPEASDAQDALDRIKQAYDLGDLVKRPLLLGMVLKSLSQLPRDARVGTADVYEAYLAQWLEHTHSGDPECFSDAQKSAFAEALAEGLWRSGKQRCSWKDLQQSVREHMCRDLPEDMPPGAAFLEIQGGAFFVHEGDDQYRFAHKSLSEYFFARALVRTLPERPAEALATKRITPEVAAFVGEVLKRAGDPRISAAVQTVKKWVVEGRCAAVETTAEAAANALRLLLELGRWTREPAGWMPEGADLRAVQMPREDLHGARLVNARLDEALFAATDLSETNLRGARLDNALLSGATLNRSVLMQASAQKADFTQVEADGVDLRGANLSNASMAQSTWTGCHWKDAHISHVKVTACVAVGPDIPAEGWPATLDSTTISAAVATSHIAQTLAWSPDGAHLASVGADGTLRKWDAETGLQLARIVGHDSPVCAVAWHPAKSLIATGGDDGCVRLWNSETGKEIGCVRVHSFGILSIAWHPGGQLLATCGLDRNVRMLEVSGARRQIFALSGHEGEVYTVAWNKVGSELIGAGERGVIWVWNPRTRVMSRKIQSDGQPMHSAYHSQQDIFASARQDGTVRLLRLETQQELPRFVREPDVVAITWDPSGAHFATATAEGVVRMWSMSEDQRGTRLGQQTARVSSLAWSPDGNKIASAGHDYSIRIWNVSTGEQTSVLQGHNDWVSSVKWEPGGTRLAFGGADGAVKVWESVDGRQLVRFGDHRDGVDAVAWSDDGQFVVSGGRDKMVRVWRVANAELIAEFERHHEMIVAAEFRADSHVVATSDASGRVWVFDIFLYKQATEIASSKVVHGPARGLSWSADGANLAVGGIDGIVRVWRVTGGWPSSFEPHLIVELCSELRIGIRSVAWCPTDGNLIASTCDDGSVWLWDVRKKAGVAFRNKHEGAAIGLSWHPSGRSIATIGADGTMRTWNVGTLEQVYLWEAYAHPTWGWGVCWNHDGTRLASAGSDGAVHVWGLYHPISRAPLCTFQVSGDNSLARTPGGFCLFGEGDPSRYRLALRRPEPGSRTVLYLPLAGLRDVLHRPDKVAAALASDLSGDNLEVELERLGWNNGVPWDGEEHRIPPAQPPVPEPQRPEPPPEDATPPSPPARAPTLVERRSPPAGAPAIPAPEPRRALPNAPGDHQVDVGIITIREDEHAAVLQRFPDKLRTVTGHRRYRLRRLRLSPTEAYTVAVLRCAEQGNGEAQAATMDLIQDLAPTWILVVGIAGGVPAHEVSLGDVVVSTRIADFSVEAVLKDHSRDYALAGGPLHPNVTRWVADIRAMAADHELDGWNDEAAIGRRLPPVEVADDKFYGDDAWRKDVREKIERRFVTGRPRQPLVTMGAVASSDRLIKDAEILQVWLKMARQVQAVEMESAGVYRAAHGRQVPFLAIRGISDVVGYKRHPDWTDYACHSAAAFTLAFLRARPIEPRGGPADGKESDDDP